MQKEIGIVLKQIRQHRMLTQEYMAFKLHITPESYANIEAGRVDVNCKKLHSIAVILDIKAQHIFGLAEALCENKHITWMASWVSGQIKLHCSKRNLVLRSTDEIVETVNF